MVEADAAKVELARRCLETMPRFHFIGIGGVGMSALARYLLDVGKTVSGSDRSPGRRLAELRRRGAAVVVGHDAAAVPDRACVVYTTAIADDNVELAEACRRGLPVVHRAELLAAVVNARRALAVTGTHGKTTTTAMLAHILVETGHAPLAFVGGEVRGWPEGNLLLGRGDLAVYEACESDGTLLLYRPAAAIITSLEPDHLDQHQTFDHLQATVARFARSVRPDGFIVHCADYPTVTEAVGGASARLVSYGRAPSARWRVIEASARGAEGIEFSAAWPGGTFRARIPAIGTHNALNATAAIAAAYLLCDLPPAEAAEALASYPGVARRFELVGTVGSSPVVHDYAHHPTEVRATIRAARDHLPGRLLVVFQPHLYSRTRDLMDQFARCFAEADEVIILPIYPAREDPIPGITGKALAERVAAARGGRPTAYADDPDQLAAALRARCSDGWIILVLGAGDVELLAHKIAAGEAEDDEAPGR